MNNAPGLWLVTSSAYVGQELAAEFGHLPPAFLPVGTSRLYEGQLDRLAAPGPVTLTVPESYRIPPEDVARLAERGVTLLPLPDDLSLGEAVVFALNLIGGPDQPVRILHGDTMVEGIDPAALDVIGAADGSEGYSWAEITRDGDRVTGLETVAAGLPSERRAPVACGYFAFAHSTALVRGITRARGDFVGGILAYAGEHPLAAIDVRAWFDFGHLQTFFRSRRLLMSARAFNTLRIDGRTARKLSADGAKMRAEASWFAAVPPGVRVYTGRLVDAGEAEGVTYYDTEYEYLPTLSELFVFGTLGRPAWMRMLHSCQEFLALCAASPAPDMGPGTGDAVLHQLVFAKTDARLRAYADATGFDLDAGLHYDGRPMPSLRRIAALLPDFITPAPDRVQSVMHGDFCFSNILYDSRVQRIRTIDPRGYVQAGVNTIFGDGRYDLAKLAHSVAGRYDQIIAGRYAAPPSSGTHFTIGFESAAHHLWLEAALADIAIDGISAGGPEIRAITISLFLSMLPLHADRPDRQRAFIANALRLFRALAGDLG